MESEINIFAKSSPQLNAQLSNAGTRLTLTALLVFFTLVFLSSSFAGEAVYGIYKTEPGDTGGYLHVEISACVENKDETCGVIIEAYKENGDHSKDYEHLGKLIVWGMRIKGEGLYSKGRIWAPDRDKTYRSKMRLEGTRLKVSGCVGPFCRAQRWEKIK